MSYFGNINTIRELVSTIQRGCLKRIIDFELNYNSKSVLIIFRQISLIFVD